MLKQVEVVADRACLIPFYENGTMESLYYEDESGICNPNLTPTRGCVPPFYSTSDPGIHTDYKGPCNPDFSPDSYFTVAPTPGGKPGFKLDSTTMALIAGIATLVLVLGMSKRK